MNIQQLFTWSYWLTQSPGQLSNATTLFFLAFFCLCIAAPFLLALHNRIQKKTLSKPEKRLMQKIQSLCVTMGIFGLIWLAFAYETLPILSGRYWMLIWLASAATWMYVVYGFAIKDMKAQLDQIHQREQLSKYMPRGQRG